MVDVHAQKMLNVANSIKEIINKNGRDINVILQSHSGDLSTAVATLVHALIMKEKLSSEEFINYIKRLLDHEILDGNFRVFYVNPRKELFNQNAVLLALLKALKNIGFDKDYALSLNKAFISDYWDKYKPKEKDYMVKNIPGFPGFIRKDIWSSLLDIEGIKKRYPIPFNEIMGNTDLDVSSIIEMINNDLPRSYCIKEEQKEKLKNVLIGVCKAQLHYNHVAKEKLYVQGYNLLASVLLKVFDDAELTYFSFLSLLFSNKFRFYDLYSIENYPKNFIIPKTFRILLQNKLPEVSQNLLKIDVYKMFPNTFEWGHLNIFSDCKYKLPESFKYYDEEWKKDFEEIQTNKFCMAIFDRFLHYGHRYIVSFMYYLIKHTFDQRGEIDRNNLLNLLERNFFDIPVLNKLSWGIIRGVDSEMISEDEYNKYYSKAERILSNPDPKVAVESL